MGFKREDRYVVLKIKDLREHMPQLMINHLMTIVEEVEARRRSAGKLPLECVVVESDWPEYEPTRAAIEARIANTEYAKVGVTV